MKKIKERHVLAAAYGLLNLADYLTTKKILKNGGRELNPIVRFLIKHNCFGAAKILTSASVMSSMCNENSDQSTNRGLVGFYTLIVANNLAQIIIQEKNKKTKV